MLLQGHMKLPALAITKHRGECPHVSMTKGHISDQIYHVEKEEIAL